MLSGSGTDSTEYKLYGDAPVSVDGYKKRVKKDDGFTQTQMYKHGHFAKQSCIRNTFKNGHKQYSYQEYPIGDEKFKVWTLTHDLVYKETYLDATEGNWIDDVTEKFDKNSMTWAS